MRFQVVLAIALAAFVSQATNAAPCSQSQRDLSYRLYVSAGNLPGCRPYASSSGDGGVKINWSCTTTSCTPIIRSLADQLPNCEADGISQKTQLENALYQDCKLCSIDQDKQIAAMWGAAAATAACAPYARTSSASTSFSWPCSASACTAVLKELANKVPDCITGTQSEKNRILNAVKTCTSTTPSTLTPSPMRTSTGASSPPTDASDPCSDSQRVDSASLWKAAAATPACSKYATWTESEVEIIYPCTATSCRDVMASLGAKLPSCLQPGRTTSEKSEVLKEVDQCLGISSGAPSSPSTKTDSNPQIAPGAAASAGAHSTLPFVMQSCIFLVTIARLLV